ncbi:MAG: DUF1232 domain-containing protein [Chloroflexi bacterium]|nr:DUF1232 domain-containing protein [Chloroflexota bacterium]
MYRQRLEAWKVRARNLKREVYALYLAYQDPRTPWLAKVLTICVVGYALSPIDLIPDPIPILGYLDDLLLLPLGIALVLKLIPAVVMEECRSKAQITLAQKQATNWVAAIIIIIIWLLVAGAIGWLIWQRLM